MEQHVTSQAVPIDGELQNLRRTCTPYIGQISILSAVTVFLVVVALKSGERNFLWAVPVMWGLYAPQVLIGLRYRVLYDEIGVVMRASGGPERRVRFDEITEIKYEIGASESRPFRRLVILGRPGVSDAFIDVSLRHFQLNDIQKLLSEIHVHRPELTLPAIPLR